LRLRRAACARCPSCGCAESLVVRFARAQCSRFSRCCRARIRAAEATRPRLTLGARSNRRVRCAASRRLSLPRRLLLLVSPQRRLSFCAPRTLFVRSRFAPCLVSWLRDARKAPHRSVSPAGMLSGPSFLIITWRFPAFARCAQLCGSN
jgi:hypothetical protein